MPRQPSNASTGFRRLFSENLRLFRFFLFFPARPPFLNIRVQSVLNERRMLRLIKRGARLGKRIQKINKNAEADCRRILTIQVETIFLSVGNKGSAIKVQRVY